MKIFKTHVMSCRYKQKVEWRKNMPQDIMDGYEETEFSVIVWIGLLITGLCGVVSILFYRFTSFPISFFGMLIFVILGILSFWLLVWTYFYRYLADKGWFWLRVPEMKAAFVEKDRGLYRIFVNVSGELRDHFIKLAAYKNYQAGYERMVVLKPGKQIVWLGLPWVYRLKTPWYEHTDDIKNEEKDPVRFLDIKERVINYPGGGAEKPVIPDVDSADPIQIRAQLVVSLRVFDPEKALYNVQFFMEAVQNEIAGRWRNAISGLSYFQVPLPPGKDIKDITDKERIERLEINPHIQKQVHEKFSVFILKVSKLIEKTAESGKKSEEEENFKPTIEFNKREGKLDYKDNFPEFSPAYDILNNWGIQLMHVEVRDLDPLENIRKALDERSEALAKAAARLKQAQGERAYKEEVAQGDKAIEMARREGIAAGIKAIAEIAKSEGGNTALAADTAIRLAGETENLVTEGGLAGLVGQILRVAEAIKSAPGK